MSMDITKIRLNLEAVAGGKEVLLLEIREQYAYENNKLSDKIEYKCRFVLPENFYEQLVVKVLTKPLISQELLQRGEPVRVTLEGFEARIYRNYQNSTYGLSCKAKSLIVLK